MTIFKKVNIEKTKKLGYTDNKETYAEDNAMYMKNGKKSLDKKFIRISSKRQITIPQKYYEALGFEDQAECLLNDGVLIIRPVRENVGFDFSEQILTDLITEGYSGDELLKKFKERSAEIKEAIHDLMDTADNIAEGKDEY